AECNSCSADIEHPTDLTTQQDTPSWVSSKSTRNRTWSQQSPPTNPTIEQHWTDSRV
ncbi:unnamed protein product, partial [Mycena citricolor]